MTLSTGSILHNRYRILSILGQGGMGAVYRAHDNNLEIEVAVKENQFLSDEYSRQFRREASILASLRHPNLPRVIDYFVIPGQGQYLIMDYIEGEDLRQRIERDTRVPEQEVVLIGAFICDAIDYLHKRNPTVVHRDLKPGNIKITPDGEAFLVDFGLVKLMQGGEETTTGARAMTPGYSPPEQYGTARTDPRSDIYSLGATLYAALTGVIPEDGLSRATGKVELTPVKKLSPSTSRKLSSALEKALAVDPEKRFQNAAEFKQALLEAIGLTITAPQRLALSPAPVTDPSPLEPDLSNGTGKEIEFKPISMPLIEPRTKQQKRVTRIITYAIGSALIALITLGAFLIWSPELNNLVASFTGGGDQASLITEMGTTQPDNTSTSEVGASPSSTPDHSSTQSHANPVSSVTQQLEANPTPIITLASGGETQLAFVSNRTGTYQIWMMDLPDGSNTIQLTSIPEGACQPEWSPDGTQIAFISPCAGKLDEYPGAAIYIMNADGTNIHVLPVPPNPQGDFEPAWSPNGRYIAFTSLRNGPAHIFRFDLETNTLEELSNSRYDDRYPSWSPSGLQIAYSHHLTYFQIWLMSDSGQGPQQYSLSGPLMDIWPEWMPDGQTILFSQTSTDVFWPQLHGLTFENRGTENDFIIPPDSASQAAIGPVFRISLSPDGGWVAFEGWPDGRNHDIYIMTINGTNLRRLTTDPDWDMDPDWRPIIP
ncbi:MAG TPA: protein kinase [Longilinea sp.]|nr:protein kinase [Longilinea sp.]